LKQRTDQELAFLRQFDKVLLLAGGQPLFWTMLLTFVCVLYLANRI
jgi:hypothetical protein